MPFHYKRISTIYHPGKRSGSCNPILKKCSILQITRKKTTQIYEYLLRGHILKSENSSKYLGITVDNKRCWNDQAYNICSKANGLLTFLRRNLKKYQTHIKANTCTILVRPQLEYMQQSKTRISWRWFNIALHGTSLTTTPDSPMLHQCCINGDGVALCREEQIYIFFFHKCLHGLSKDLIPQTREARGNHSKSYICLGGTRNYRNYSFLPRTIVQWNKLPEAVVTSPSLDTYREGVCRLTH